MKQKLCQKIQLLQNKYQIHKRLSIDSNPKYFPSPMAYQQNQPHQNLSDVSVPLFISRNHENYHNCDPNREITNTVTQRPMTIGKKSFDLSLYKAQTSYRQMERKSKIYLRLPPLKSTFSTQLYSEITAKRQANFNNFNNHLGCQSSIKKRALQKVDSIYASEQNLVDEKHQKIMKIKNRLKLLNKISKDKLKLQSKISSFQNL